MAKPATKNLPVKAEKTKAASGPITVKRGVAKKSSSTSVPTQRITRRINSTTPAGFTEGPNGIVVPITSGNTVSPTKFTKGLKSAKNAIQSTIAEFSDFMTQDMEISEIELTVSINAKGEFLGFGIGGDASVKIKIRPILPSA